jgi:hypothetical protein
MAGRKEGRKKSSLGFMNDFCEIIYDRARWGLGKMMNLPKVNICQPIQNNH